MRIQSSKVLDAQMRALGAHPAGDGVFARCIRRCRLASSTAPRTRDSNIYTQKMHEVQKFLTVTDHGVHRVRRSS